MKRKTHLLLGAAVAMPIAAPLSPGLALGCLWMGTVGGGFPDWLDLRSEVGRVARLEHRGVSHGIPLGVAFTFGVWHALSIVAGTSFDAAGAAVRMPVSAVLPWTIAFGLGVASHLVSDAMTHAGIRPLLPLSQWKLRLLPRPLRSRYDGYLDRLLRWCATVSLLTGFILFVAARW